MNTALTVGVAYGTTRLLRAVDEMTNELIDAAIRSGAGDGSSSGSSDGGRG